MASINVQMSSRQIGTKDIYGKLGKTTINNGDNIKKYI
jgi:hypothetical protein